MLAAIRGGQEDAMPRFSFAAGSIAALWAIAACAGDAQSPAGGDDGWGDAGPGTLECFSSSECPTGWSCSEFGTCVPPDPGAPDGGAEEVEIELSPAASALRYVYVAMTELDALAKIDGATLAVASIAVGDRPEVVAAVPLTDAAVVLDRSNGTATIVRPTEDRDDTTTVKTMPNLNAIAIDPHGRYAVAWFDLAVAAQEAGGLDFVDEIGSFQDVTVVDLELGEEQAIDLTVGFRPRAVEFAADGSRAFVVTDDGVSVIDLALVAGSGPSIVAPIAVTDDPLADPLAIEVNVTPDGAHAVVRETGRAELRVVALDGAAAGEIWTIPLPAEPSDVDIAPDGTRAYAVLRDAGTIALVDVPGDAIDPAGVELVALGGVAAGSLVMSDDGARGLVFTNAALDERIAVIDLAGADHAVAVHRLTKSVLWAAFDPSGTRALVIHARAPGDPAEATTFDDYIDRSSGYSVLDVATGFAKLQITPVDPGELAFAPDAPRAYLLLDGGDAEGAVAAVQIIELDTGVVREEQLGSPPDAVGILPTAGVAFVSQRHPLGRVSFVNLMTGALRTVTGFDLNGRIID
jgi:DNA-binding beta-propeller fold protein YncE